MFAYRPIFIDNTPSCNDYSFMGYFIHLPPSFFYNYISRLESLLEKINEAKRLIEEAKETFASRRAAIFTKAFRGELTEKWREEEREIIPAPQFSSPPSEIPYNLPEGWNWVRVEDVCENIVDCPHSTPKYIDEGIPAIRTSDLGFAKLNTTNARRVSKEEYKERTKRLVPQNGDIIYSREGTIGLAGMVTDENVCLAQRVMLFRPNKEIINNYYFLYAMSAPVIYNQAMKNVASTTSPHVNIRDIKNFAIPLAPIKEQEIIADLLNKYLTLEEEFTKVGSTGEILDQLSQFILGKAFHGELGTNDPEEESAIELLKEIYKEIS
jgi:type I restriction enzyme, S subunit